MGTIITDRNLLAILKGAEALARELRPRYPHLFAEQQPQPAPPPPVATDPARDARAGAEEAAA